MDPQDAADLVMVSAVRTEPSRAQTAPDTPTPAGSSTGNGANTNDAAPTLSPPPSSWLDQLPSLPWISEIVAQPSGTQVRVRVVNPAGISAGTKTSKPAVPAHGDDRPVEPPQSPTTHATKGTELPETLQTTGGIVASKAAATTLRPAPAAAAGGAGARGVPMFRVQTGISQTLRKPLRVYRLDHTFHTVLMSVFESAADLLARFSPWIGGPIKGERLTTFGVYEVETQTCARRELDRDELPLAVVMGWDADMRKTMRIYVLPRVVRVPSELIPFMSAREKASERLLRRTSYRISVQLPDRTVVYMSVHPQSYHHEVVAGLLSFTSVGGRHGKYYAAGWGLWLSEPDLPVLSVPDDAAMLDVLLSCQRWRDCVDGVLFLLRKHVLLPDPANATTPGLPSSAVQPVLPVR